MKAPAGLGPSGRALWRAILADLPKLEDREAELDARELALLEQACNVRDRIAALATVIKRDGVTSKGSTGQKVVHPAIAEERQQRVVLRQLLGAIGINPPAYTATESPRTVQARRAAQARYARRDRLHAIKGGRA